MIRSVLSRQAAQRAANLRSLNQPMTLLRPLSAASNAGGGAPPPRGASQQGKQGVPRPSFTLPSGPRPPAQQGGAPTAAAGGKVIFDVSSTDFAQVVLNSPVPVILDCWAEWCGPCKQLTPVIESAVRALGGRVRLAKLDTDKNPQLAQQLKVTRLPTVMLVHEGKLVDQFTGFTGEAKVKEFVAKAASLSGSAGPAQGDPNDLGVMQQMLTSVIEMLKMAATPGQPEKISTEEITQMIGALRTLASQKLDPLPQGATKTAKRRADEDALEIIRAIAHAGLIRCALLDGNTEAAQDIAKVAKNSFSKAALEHTEVKSALSLVNLVGGASASESKRSELESKLKQNPGDSDSRLELAKTLFADGSHSQAIEQALELLKRDRGFKDGAARTLLLDIFNALGSNDLVKEARRRMTSILMH